MQVKTIFVSAAEVSADQQSAHVLSEFLNHHASQYPKGENQIKMVGIAGPELRKLGVEPWAKMEDLNTLGFVEVLWKLPKLFLLHRQIKKRLREEPPSLCILVDYPGYHFILGKWIARELNIPIWYFIPPKIWAWKKHRLKIMKQFVNKVISILPFEGRWYEQAGMRFEYIGNPLAQDLLAKQGVEAVAPQIQFSNSSPRDFKIALLPGSRNAEVRRHLPILFSALEKFLAKSSVRFLQVKIPVPGGVWELTKTQVEAWKNNLSGTLQAKLSSIEVTQDASEALSTADAALVKSGTATLVAGVLGCPHLVFYRGNRISEFLFKNLVRYRGPVGLSNLIPLGPQQNAPYLVPELLGPACTPDLLVKGLVDLLESPENRKRLEEGFGKLRQSLKSTEGYSPSQAMEKSLVEFFQLSSAETERNIPF